MNQHIGSSFDDFLKAEGLLAAAAIAWQRVIAFLIRQLAPSEPQAIPPEISEALK
jgi:hypothetical protein